MPKCFFSLLPARCLKKHSLSLHPGNIAWNTHEGPGGSMSRPVVACIDAVCGRCHTEMRGLWRMPAEGPEAFGSQRERVYTASHTTWTTRPPDRPGPPTPERRAGPKP